MGRVTYLDENDNVIVTFTDGKVVNLGSIREIHGPQYRGYRDKFWWIFVIIVIILLILIIIIII